MSRENLFDRETAVGRNYYQSHIRWTAARYMPFRGKWYRVGFEQDFGGPRYPVTTGIRPRSVLDARGLVCAFDTRTVEKPRQVGSEAVPCQAIIEDGERLVGDTAVADPEATREDLARGFDLESFYRRNSFEVSETPLLVADIDNDGVEERDLFTQISTANRTACDTTYVDLVGEDGRVGAAGDARARLLEAQGFVSMPAGWAPQCARDTELIRHEGVVYLSRGRDIARTVSRIRDGEVRTVCASDFTFEAETVFRRDGDEP